MNNWGIVFVIVGIIIVLSIISGYLLTNKVITIVSEEPIFRKEEETEENLVESFNFSEEQYGYV